MTNKLNSELCYQAFCNRDSAFDGSFFVGVTSTKIVCNPSCPARKPIKSNCQFFERLDSATNNGYRPCKRCKPQLPPQTPPTNIQSLVNDIYSKPTKSWAEKDLTQYGLSPSTARRQFNKYFQQSFAAFARKARLAHAQESMAQGQSVTTATFDSGFESTGGFRQAFIKLFEQAPSKNATTLLHASWHPTPIGVMLAISNNQFLYALDFANTTNLSLLHKKICAQHGAVITPGETAISAQIGLELAQYFEGTLTIFNTPICFTGTEFQQCVWQALRQIPFGQTWSYQQQAKYLHKPTAVRAVASANGKNTLAIIAPCHRVIGSNGKLTGYAGGVDRKAWLLTHEAEFKSAQNGS